MRIGLVLLVALVLGTSIGLAATWFEFGGVQERFEPKSRTKAGETPESDTAAASAVVVGGTKFDFGVMNPDQTREQTFVIRNEGGAPLVVEWERESCGMCIQNNHKFSKTSVEPGESCNVIVTYSTKKPVLRFEESAYLKTNDPRNSSIRLEITGDIVRAFRLEPESLALSSILTSETTSVSVKLFGYRSTNMEIVKHVFSNPTTGPSFEVTTKPLDDMEVKSVKHALAGLEIMLRLQPGLPIGPLNQTITFTVKSDTEHLVDLPVTGTVVGDLSIVGQNYNAQQSVYGIGLVSQELGRRGELFVLVKGPHRDNIQITVGEVEPAEALEVTVGKPIPFADGKATKTPITITVPKGTPKMSRYGNAQGKAGRIVLQTTHPYTKQLPIEVRFAVE